MDVGNQIQTSQHGLLPQESVGLVRLKKTHDKSTHKKFFDNEEETRLTQTRPIRLFHWYIARISSHFWFPRKARRFCSLSLISVPCLDFCIGLALTHFLLSSLASDHFSSVLALPFSGSTLGFLLSSTHRFPCITSEYLPFSLHIPGYRNHNFTL